ncbi:hypothetical protein GQ457_06G010250 [Hibiscus cannabinus]
MISLTATPAIFSGHSCNTPNYCVGRSVPFILHQGLVGSTLPNMVQVSSFPTAHVQSTSNVSGAPSSLFATTFSLGSSIVTGSREVVWYPDSGATHHITNDRANL